MPNLQAAKKDLRQTKKRTARNKIKHAEIRDYMRQSRKAAEKKDIVKTEDSSDTNPQNGDIVLSIIDGSKTTLEIAIKALDKALQKGLLKKNTVARRKSILVRRLNAVKK